ncbi:SusC/RagA family TonB-linked outer membrane protein [Hymenobacter pini]|uniref:SusC/RagA family TonB-linked outer membrane protein n=1 Tax=Hymenobacter pini TaxID=2880879 RepID=UPI001CF41D8B|nr:SusC/RagA family TonB-linked outer membrane protein [Hymenobacter pini]MCA8833106.1 SusC/RagA family TonB-linked outer membrane protein [Hymenobacter pini]
MIRLYSLGLLLPLSIPALAQQTDTVRLPSVAVQDSVVIVKSYCPTAQYLSSYNRILPLLPIQEQLRQVAGVQATPYSRAPGAQVAVRIRGAASLASNAQPLYVVDGVPVFQHTFRPGGATSLTGVVPAEAQELDVNPLLSIPNEDIEQVEVLKGAYETALYGSQGLNGVIKITTKRGKQGKQGKPRLSYQGYGGAQQARNRYELLDAREYATLRNEAAERNGQPAPYTAAQLAALGRGTDWQAELLRTAAVQEHHLGLAGGTAATRYYAAADYLGQQGVVLNSRLRRYAARAALNQRIGQHLHLDGTASFAQTEQRVPAYYALENALLRPPVQLSTDNPRPEFYTLPTDLARQSYQSPTQRRLLAQLGVRYELTTGLTLEVRGNLERATLRSRSYQPAYTTLPGGENGNLFFTYRQLVLNPALRYARNLRGGRHAVTASLEAMRQDRKTTTEQYRYFPGSPSTTLSGNGSLDKAGMNFYQLTAGYTFAEKYQVKGTLRRDGSSTFALDDRWSWLPGAQVLWHAAKENFWNSAPARLDAWVGWGRTSGAGNYGRNSFSIGVPGQANLPQTIAFLPEQTQQLDAGTEADLFNQHLTATVQAYHRRTNSTFYVGGPLSSRGTSELHSLRNTGLELTLSGRWQAGPVQASTRLAAAANRNRYTSNEAYLPTPYTRTFSGYPVGTFYGLRYLGVDATGKPRFVDTNGDGQSNYGDSQPIGSGLPKRLLSFSQQLTLSRFELQLQVDGMFGYQMQNTSLEKLELPTGYYNASRRVLDRWTPTNTATDVPVAGTYNLPFSTYTLQSGNHARLSSVTFSYKVWEKEARSVQLWTSGLNLLVFTRYRGYDPNVSSAGSDNQQAGLDVGAYPVARTVLVGVRATL